MHSQIADNPHRRLFPRGLVQPEHGFRFSIDALLLACFAAGRQHRNVIDLGTGCGVVSLGLLLLDQERCDQVKSFHVLGVDKNPEMVAAAQANAAKLDFAARFTSVLGNVAAMNEIPGFRPGGFDAALCNPPYRPSGHGRMPSNPARQSAMFETDTRTEDFLEAASRALSTKGRLYMVHLPEHLPRLLGHLAAVKLEPKRLRLVHAHRDKSASLLLLETGKGGNPGLSVEPPLILYHRDCSAAGDVVHRITDEALTFCPFLDCNSSRPSQKPPEQP
ncbi:tRNA1(Val) (adenine(37)-N6)-methyltransferase [Desulfonatronum sp. SC1]|uniref:tRNA1(Val) (adenine(37)-N6)-methyltransferase n=1 Tax=Desulfonatronum sp. SC1 TaxID=2109626 RepID=UPI000D321F2F|nr:methyltransferase domain-containing protein [Desulfonatronum sp. SC1]PTN34139.1 methyltransferase [Desulfonatronum sp. SC1]